MTVVARTAVCAAVAAWAGVGGWWPIPVALVLGRWVPRLRLRRIEYVGFLVVFTLGSVLGWMDRRPPEALPPGDVSIEGRVEVDLGERWGWSGLVATDAGTVLVRSDHAPRLARVRVTGVSDGRRARVLGRWTVATVTAEAIGPPVSAPVHDRLAGMLERRILREVRPESGTARGLLVGFLIGDTSGVSPLVLDEMRRAGLSHLVAVSGSNVALFLVGLVVLTAPLSMRPLGRLVIMLNGLVVFGTLTRWEPSVLRAASMAGLVGMGRFVGVPLEPITALALVSGAAVLLSPPLVGSVGLQLSVVATAGLMLAARVAPRRGRVASLLVATMSAQAAVAPVLLAAFGSVPLLAPIANLIAIPLVTAATALAGIGAAMGAEWVIGLGAFLAEGFVLLARVAAPWPQLDALGCASVVAIGLLGWRLPRTRPLLVSAAAITAAMIVIPSASGPHTGLIVLDVGQGDAMVVRLAGHTVLVDGGPDPARLAAGLARHGIDRIDLAIATHVHEDHVAGLGGILERVPVSGIWAAFEPHETPASRELAAQASARGVPIDTPKAGDRVVVGADAIEVVGPLRRYANPNDQSIVLVVDIAGTRVLLSGDIETVAQSELSVAGVDVLKVPHQGAATSDPDWLATHAGALAIVSVGPNTFGHPAEWVLDALRAAGATVVRTDLSGDVVLDLEDATAPRLRTSVRPRVRATRGGRRSCPRHRGSSSPRCWWPCRCGHEPHGRGWWQRSLHRLPPSRAG